MAGSKPLGQNAVTFEGNYMSLHSRHPPFTCMCSLKMSSSPRLCFSSPYQDHSLLFRSAYACFLKLSFVCLPWTKGLCVCYSFAISHTINNLMIFLVSSITITNGPRKKGIVFLCIAPRTKNNPKHIVGAQKSFAEWVYECMSLWEWLVYFESPVSLKMLLFNKYLLCSRHRAKHFSWSM